MIEIKLVSVSFNIQPIFNEEEDRQEEKQLNFFHGKTDTVYMVPLTKKAADSVIEHLKMPNAELQEMLKKQAQAQRAEDLLLPKGQIPPMAPPKH